MNNVTGVYELEGTQSVEDYDLQMVFFHAAVWFLEQALQVSVKASHDQKQIALAIKVVSSCIPYTISAVRFLRFPRVCLTMCGSSVSHCSCDSFVYLALGAFLMNISAITLHRHADRG